MVSTLTASMARPILPMGCPTCVSSVCGWSLRAFRPFSGAASAVAHCLCHRKLHRRTRGGKAGLGRLPAGAPRQVAAGQSGSRSRRGKSRLGAADAYAGPRLSEALRLTWADIDLRAATALLRQTKNGEPVVVHLPPPAIAAFADLDKTKRRVVCLSKCARLYALVDKAEKLSGATPPPGSAFHMLRHSHAMWRRLFTGADTAALVASGLWKSRNAASVYEHLDLSAESRKSDLFPTPRRAKGGR